MDNKIIELKHPIATTKDGAKVTIPTVVLRRLKAKDLKHLPADGGSTPAGMIPLIASVTGLAVADVEEMDLEDLVFVVQELSAFSAAYLGNGSGSSGV